MYIKMHMCRTHKKRSSAKINNEILTKLSLGGTFM